MLAFVSDCLDMGADVDAARYCAHHWTHFMGAKDAAIRGVEMMRAAVAHYSVYKGPQVKRV